MACQGLVQGGLLWPARSDMPVSFNGKIERDERGRLVGTHCLFVDVSAETWITDVCDDRPPDCALFDETVHCASVTSSSMGN